LPENLKVHSNGIANLILNLKKEKAAGPDGINDTLLKLDPELFGQY